MKDNQYFDIVIIGGSYAGLYTALSLSSISDSLKIAIIEKNDIVKLSKEDDKRVFAISKLSISYFKKYNIYNYISDKIGLIKEIKISDNDYPFIVDFLSDDKMGIVINSYHIYNALKEEINKKNNITLFSPNSYKNIDIKDNYNIITLDNDEIIKSSLIIACDGKNSNIRSLFNLPLHKNKSYNQSAISFNICHNYDHNNIAWEKFTKSGPFAILPMKDKNHSTVIFITTNIRADSLINLNEDEFLSQIDKMINLLNPLNIKYYKQNLTLKLLNKPRKYNLSLNLMKDFYHKNIIFISDAAHSIHPIAGQGFNLSIKNIEILSRLIKDNYNCGIELNSKILIKKYNLLAKKNSYKMAYATDIINRLFLNNSHLIKIGRICSFSILNKLPKLKNFFINQAGGDS